MQPTSRSSSTEHVQVAPHRAGLTSRTYGSPSRHPGRRRRSASARYDRSVRLPVRRASKQCSGPPRTRQRDSPEPNPQSVSPRTRRPHPSRADRAARPQDSHSRPISGAEKDQQRVRKPHLDPRSYVGWPTRPVEPRTSPTQHRRANQNAHTGGGPPNSADPSAESARQRISDPTDRLHDLIGSARSEVPIAGGSTATLSVSISALRASCLARSRGAAGGSVHMQSWALKS